MPGSRLLIAVGAFLLLLAIASTIALARATAPPTPPSMPGNPMPVGIAADLPPGQLAVPLRTAQGLAVAGVLRRGDHVDVLAFFPASPTTPAASRLLLPDQVVLAVAQDGSDSVLTLAVTADGAATLQQASLLQARPYVALRAAAGGPQTVSTDWFTDAMLSRLLAGGH